MAVFDARVRALAALDASVKFSRCDSWAKQPTSFAAAQSFLSTKRLGPATAWESEWHSAAGELFAALGTPPRRRFL